MSSPGLPAPQYAGHHEGGDRGRHETEVGVDHGSVPGRACGQQSIEAGPEDPEDDGAQEREEVTGVSDKTGIISSELY